jgi:hypothetical protein
MTVLTERLPDEQRPDAPVDDQPSSARGLRWRRLSLATLAPYAIAVVSTLYFFRRTLATGLLPGNAGDARWTVSVYEHWFEVWQGDEAIRGIPFFFPMDQTLGMSDAFLMQGQLHAAARVLGLDPVVAWASATIGMYLIGALGFALLSSVVLRSTVFRCLFVVLVCLSYPITVMIGHPQVAGFMWVSWIFAGAVLVGDRSRGRLGVYLLIVVPPLLVLSSWYAAILGVLTLVTLAAFLALLTPGAVLRGWLVRAMGTLAGSVRPWYGWLACAGGVALWSLAVWVYLPARNVSPPGEWEEVPLYSPHLSDLFNASSSGGGIWARFYEAAYDAASFNHERALGYTPLLAVAMIIVGTAALRRLALFGGSTAERATQVVLSTAKVCVAGLLTVATLAMTTVVDERGTSLYRVLWEFVPGFDSVRSPFRIQLVLYPLALFVVVAALEAWVLRARRSTERAEVRSGRWTLRSVSAAVIAGLVSLGVLVEMQRGTELKWSAADLAAPELRAQIPAIQENCEVFVLDTREYPDGTPTWKPAVDAVMLSMLAEVPTADGYSRAAPKGHPGFAAPPEAMTAWMRGQGYGGSVCVVSTTDVEVVAS